MSDLLLELLTEEIPARMQEGAREELRRAVEAALAAAGLAFDTAQSFVTPRRLALSVTGLPLAQKEVFEERRGPRVGAPPPAIEGFLRSAGVATLANCEERDTGRGAFYFAVIRRPGQPTAALLPRLLREVIVGFPWPKSMRFPAAEFRWVRPLRSVIALFDGEILPLALDGIPVGDTTLGHRFLAPGPIRVRDVEEYRDALRHAHVLLDANERRHAVEAGLARASAVLGRAVKPDPTLLAEVTGLVEWPVVLAGRIDPHFMELPPEVLTTSMRTHQKYFAMVETDGWLAPHFLVVANLEAADGGRAIVEGNERVLRARLSDARFFWDQDRKVALAARVPKLAERVFYEPLGTMLDKAARLMRLVEATAAYVPGAHLHAAQRAAELAKADLSTGMVGEFPELQGVMGRYYARHDGEDEAVADAIADHYAPQGPNDRCPSAPVSVAVALADRIDTLVGFFAIGETPTGSKDPFALRRAALGVIRLVIENKLRLPLLRVFAHAFEHLGRKGQDPAHELLGFFADRLKVHLRERGVRHDLIAAIFALGGEDDLVRLLARVDALTAFLASDDGANLLTLYRRAANIVRIEERKDGIRYQGAPEPGLYAEPAEERLARTLAEAGARGAAALAQENFSGAMAALAVLRAPVDEFFESVTVNCDDPAHRANRLRLLARIRDTLHVVADFSLIEG